MQNYFHNIQVPCYCCVTWYETRTTFFASLFSLETWASAGGKTGICPPLEIGTKNQKFLEHLKLAAKFRLLHFIVAMTVYLPAWHRHCTRAWFTVLPWCQTVMRLQFAHVQSFVCRGRLRILLVNCSTVGLYCVTINTEINLQTFTSRCGNRRF